jgi:isoleucyl-tRNA synthetase
MFDPVSNKIVFPEVEKDGTFKKSVERDRYDSEFVFYDGPPFATGLPHYGHLLAGTIKDIVPRYQAMRGNYVDRRFGWDCHGLPVEYEVEQDLKISGKTQIEKLGISVFNERCRSIVLRYTREWREVVTRMGRWVDFDNDYKTMDPEYMESIWWVFRSLWDKGLVYEGSKILPYCPRCATPLSNFETNQGYEEVTDPAVTIRFKLLDEENAYVLAWTTTPWTLPSNMALAVGHDITYVRVQDKDAVYYLAKERLPSYYKTPDTYVSLTELKGATLVGRCYEPLFPYFAGLKAKGAFRVVAADFVSTEDGTGVVHIAPGFGEEDNLLGQKEKLPMVCPVDEEGKFTAEIPEYFGQEVKAADAAIMARLKAEKKLVHRSQIKHSYPHCWRCDKPLIYRAISTWFVAVEKIKDRLVEANRKIRWVPEHLRDGRFGKWLEGARDWAISRNRYWGTPIPVWRSEDGREQVCVGSIAELAELSGVSVKDLHKHHVDSIRIPSKQGRGELRRIPEVLDCWFESGSMPYAQAHYPFENREHFEQHFPADFIAEGLDQTRGWFYTLMVLSVALFDKPAFRNVIVNGLVLASDGRKMSKRLKNYPDPSYVLDTYGADALRLYLVGSPVVRAEDLCFSEEGVKHVMRHILIPLWNAYSFFVTYANVDHWEPAGGLTRETPNLLDRWILSSLESLNEKVMTAMDNYDLQTSVRSFTKFTDDLTNWYIRRSRRRFWKSQDDDDKGQAYSTLYTVLLKLSTITAPFIPFVSESIYRNLRTEDLPESVHLRDFPLAGLVNRDTRLEEQMAVILTVVALGRQLRVSHDLKVRQPLAAIHVVSRVAFVRETVKLLSELVTDELNVKSLTVGDRETDLAHLHCKANFKTIGPKFGPDAKRVAKAITGLSEEDSSALADGKPVEVAADGRTWKIEPVDVLLEREPKAGLVVGSEGHVLVALDTKLNPDLVAEGLAREFVNKLQTMRKNADLKVTQRIRVSYVAAREVQDAIAAHRVYVETEILAKECVSVAELSDGETWDLNGQSCCMKLESVSA